MSTLLRTTIDFLSLIICMIFLSLSSSFSEISNIAIIRSASSANFSAFLTPIFSISLLVFLIPAVSTKSRQIPFILTLSSITSLVVPSTLLTIALSSSKIAFNKDDFPAFGFPIITVLIPFFNILPLLKLLISLSN